MNLLNIKRIFSFFVCFIVLYTSSFAQWSTNPAVNNAICTAVNTQSSPRIVSDGSGGAIIAWEDTRPGPTYDIYAQRISASGVVLWTVDGVAGSALAGSDQFYPELISDGSGGAIMAWRDDRNLGTTGSDIYAQRINASGAVQWTVDGVAICTAANRQVNVQLVSDGSGGAIITWLDYRSGTNDDIYAQRIDASGAVLWTVDGVAICTHGSNQSAPQLVTDGFGGAIIAWGDFRSSALIYGQRIDASGAVLWTVDGKAVSSAGLEASPQLVSDGSGGAVIAWQYLPAFPSYYLSAQRINSSGAVLWAAAGVAICTANNNLNIAHQLAYDGSGGAIITWQDIRSGNYDIYAQRINAGAVQWAANGVAICTVAGAQEVPQLAYDGSGGAIITWQDIRSGTNYDIYAQRISAGAVLWTANGVPVSTAVNGQFLPRIIANTCSSIITWQDERVLASQDNIYAAAINCDGAFLPIELLSFSARCKDETAVLNWATASEFSNDYFTIERSEDGKIFEEIEKVNGAGNSSTVQNYEFIDNSPSLWEGAGGWAFYRLRQTDYDGKSEIFGPVSVNCDSENKINIQPAVSSNGYFTITGLSGDERINVYNLPGEKVFQSFASATPGMTNAPMIIDLSEHPDGIYLVNIKTEKKEFARKIIIRK